MTLYDIKPRFQALLRPLLRRLHNRGVTANQVTLLALVMSVIAGIAFALNPSPLFLIALPIFLFVRMALNAIDGMLAREFNQQSRLGALLNELGDVVSDAALYLPFALLPNSSIMLVVLMVVLAILTEFSGLLVQTQTGKRNYAGPCGKSDRALIFGAWGLFIALWPSLLAYNNIVWCVVCILLGWTVINRCRSALTAE